MTNTNSSSIANSGDESESSSGSEIINRDSSSSNDSSINDMNNGDDDDSSDSSSSTTSRVDATDNIGYQIQGALANEYNSYTLRIWDWVGTLPPTDAQRIMDCLRENPRFTSLFLLFSLGLDNPAVLNIIRRGLLDCPSVTSVSLPFSNLTSEGLDLLRPAFFNTSIMSLDISSNHNGGSGIQGQRGGEAIHALVVGNNTLLELNLSGISFDRPFVVGLGHCLHLLQKLILHGCGIGNDDMTSLLLPADGMNNTALLHLDLDEYNIEGAEGGRQVGLLLQHCPNLKVLNLGFNDLGPLGVRAMAPGLAATSNLESLDLHSCGIGNDGVMGLVLDGQVYMSLTSLDLLCNFIEGHVGGQQVGLLLQHCPNLKVLNLCTNFIGNDGVRAMAPGLAAASNLESLDLQSCGIRNDGVMYLVPEGQVNTSLTSLDLHCNYIEGLVGGENVVALASRCTNLESLGVEEDVLNPDQHRRLDLLLDPKHRLCVEAQALAGSSFPVLFRFVEERAHGHEHGLSAIFVILQNDGDDYFCTANNHAIP